MKYIGAGIVERVFHDESKTIEVKLIEQTNSAPSLVILLPANQTHIKSPIEGEVVPVFSAPASGFTTIVRTTSLYYGDPISFTNNEAGSFLTTKNTAVSDFSPIKTPSLVRFDGDLVLEGRALGSLRITHTPLRQTQADRYPLARTWESGISQTGDPIVWLTIGKKLQDYDEPFQVEDINNDRAGLILHSGQDVKFVNPFQGDKNLLKGLSGTNKNVADSILTSPEALLIGDRLVLSSKKKDILISSQTNINLLSNTSISLYSLKPILIEGSKIFLGQTPMFEHNREVSPIPSQSNFGRAVKGEELVDTLRRLIDVVNEIVDENEALLGVKQDLDTIESGLGKILSNKVYLE